MEYLPKTKEDVKVQLIMSDGAGDIKLQHAYVIVLAPYAMGIPADQVQLYCDERFRELDEDRVRININAVNTMGPSYAKVVPDHKDFFDYFLNILSQSKLLEPRLGKCSLRIIAGHGYRLQGGGGEVAVSSGKIRVQYSQLEKATEDGPRNASVLTVIDASSNPPAVQGLKDPEFKRPSKPEQVFDDVRFPLACVKTSITNAFRVSWDGHHEVADEKSDDFANPTFRGMSVPIGFPTICSVMAAIKARSIEKRIDKDLDGLFVEKFQSIQQRFVAKGDDALVPPPEPHHDLTYLQHCFDNKILTAKEDAFDCLLFSQDKEWFVTKELVITLSRGDVRVAQKVAEFVRNEVKKWHEKNPGNLWEENVDSERAWRRLRSAMGPFCGELNAFSFEVKNDGKIIDGGGKHGDILREFAVSCASLPTIVNNVLKYLETDEDKYITGSTQEDDSSTDSLIPGSTDSPIPGAPPVTTLN